MSWILETNYELKWFRSGPTVLVLIETGFYYNLFYMLLLQAFAIVHISLMYKHISVHLLLVHKPRSDYQYIACNSSIRELDNWQSRFNQ
jgi:hypothetical protein